MSKTYKKLWFMILLSLSSLCNAALVEYEFEINGEHVNITGKPTAAVTINHQIPGPQITAKVGDTLKVTVYNRMAVDSSIHWHGILLPNQQDGVPYLTTPPIAAGAFHVYEFPVTHAGTYWYHSHSGLQEQQGAYGAIVFLPEDEQNSYNHTMTAVLSDWTDEHPNRVMANLKRDGDYYAVKKDSVQSWDKVISYGTDAIIMRLKSAWSRMGPMDISDVAYDAFLINGKPSSDYSTAKAGDSVRIRLINASASTYQIVQFSGGPMTLLAADGINVDPVDVETLRLAIAETYDVLVTIPDSGRYEFRSSSEDGTGCASLYIGEGDTVAAATVKRPNPYLEQHDMKMPGMDMHAQHAQMSHSNASMSMSQEYENLRSPVPTQFENHDSIHEIELDLTGNMERYVWSFNNRTLSESDSILIKHGEVVQVHLNNKTMMHHPVHLHGHFFRVLNGQGENSPLKHTVNIQPMSNVTIEFEATEEKDWFFHCHNLYHMKSGMARVFSYAESTTYTDDIRKLISHDTNWYKAGTIELASNMNTGLFRLSNSRNAFEMDFEHNYKNSYEVSLQYERSLNRFLDIYAGYNIENPGDDRKKTVIAGVHYMLPMLIALDVRYDTEDHLRAEISSDLQLSKHINYAWIWNTDDAYRHTLSYELNKSIALNINYDSEYYVGLGLAWMF